MSRFIKILFIFGIIAALGYFLIGRFQAVNGLKKQEIKQVIGISPVKKDITREIVLPGDVEAIYNSTIYSRVAGYLAEINVDKGDVVKKGQGLARIEAPDLKHKLDEARSEQEYAKLQYERLLKVQEKDKDLIAQADVDLAKSNANSKKAKMDNLQALYSYSNITAPFDGIITKRFVDPGALISIADDSHKNANPLLEIVNPDLLRIFIDVPEPEVPFIKVGEKVTINTDAYPDKTLTGKIARTSFAQSHESRTLLVEINISNKEYLLRPGMYARVKLVLEKHKDATILPSKAVYVDPTTDTKYIFVAVSDENKKHKIAKKQPVQTGLDDGSEVEVLDGVSLEDEVLLPSQNTIQENDLVEVKVND